MKSKTALQVAMIAMAVLTIAAGVSMAGPAPADAPTSIDDSTSLFGGEFLDVSTDGGTDDCKWNQTFEYCEPEEPEP